VIKFTPSGTIPASEKAAINDNINTIMYKKIGSKAKNKQ